MSGKEYNFSNRRKTLQIEVPKDSPKTKENVKELILEQYDRFMKLKQSDESFKQLYESKEQVSKEITTAFSQLQNTDNKTLVVDKLNHLTALYKKMETEYDQTLQKEMKPLFDRWPDIFEKIKEGIDRETLENVLTVFEQYQSGEKSADEAVISGMDFMTNKYKLPEDFFNKSAVNQFNKNLKNRR